MKWKKIKKIVSSCIAAALIMSSLPNISVKADPYDDDNLTPYQPMIYDKWKNGKEGGWEKLTDVNGKIIDVHGSAVEYNGIRIVRGADTLGTVYCKSGDTLGITSWLKTLNDTTWGYQYWEKENYLALCDEEDDNDYLTCDMHIPQATIVGRNTSIIHSAPNFSLDPNNSFFGATYYSSNLPEFSSGHLYAITFGTPGDFSNNLKKYRIESNATNYSNGAIYSIYGYASNPDNWNGDAASTEDVEVYDNKPNVSINADVTGTTSAIDMSVSDKTVGIASYTYTITNPDGTSYTQTVDAKLKGYDVGLAKQADGSYAYGTWTKIQNGMYLGGIDGAPVTLRNPAYSLNSKATVSGAGTYHVSVSAINNLGAQTTNIYDGDIIVPPTPTPPTPTPTPSPDNPDKPKPDKPKPTLDAQIVPFNNQNFVGTPTLMRGQMAILKIYTKEYAKNLNIKFPFVVLPDTDALQNSINGKSYSSFISKSMCINPQKSAETDIQFVIPLSKINISEEHYNVNVQATYQDGSTLTAFPDFNVKGNITDGIKTAVDN